jgi:NET1-associated nuclear protein 1 (U3 small nucleolar RNA-associated protein 17)
LAHPSTINVYSIETSSLIRSLPVVSSGSADAQITAFTLCHAKTTYLYTATSLGIVYLFDWREGVKLGRWKPGATVRELAISSDAGDSDGEEDIVYAREQTADKWRISAYKLRSGAAAAKTESKTLISFTHPITHFKLAHGGKAIVTASQQRLLVGATALDPASSLKELKYTWREVVVPAHITCIDVRMDDDGQRAGWKLNKAQSRSRAAELTFDVVVGDEGGRIYVHEDLLNQLVRQEREPKKPQAVPRRMHWHREAVSSVKWSRDGMARKTAFRYSC